MKYAAYAAVTLIGIFGVSMSSEANRTYVMQEVNKLVGNDVSTEIDNSDTVLTSRTEEEAFRNIEDTFDITLPQLYYMPDGMSYETCSIDTEAQVAILQYTYKEQIINWLVFANDKESSRFSQGYKGEYVEAIESNLTLNLKAELWEIKEEGDERETYTLQWNYKNVYNEIIGKIEKNEVKKIAEKVAY